MTPPVLYFGPYDRVGHYLRGPDGRMVTPHGLVGLGFWNVLGDGMELDGDYCPGRVSGAHQYAKRTRPEVEGEARLTHENGLTILGIWDRSVDKRPGSHSTYIAQGAHDFETMRRLCEETYSDRWRKLADRVEIKLVEEMKQ